MDEIIDLINNSNLTKYEYQHINKKIYDKIRYINQNEYSQNLFISIKKYNTTNIKLLDLINNINNISVHYDEPNNFDNHDIVCIHFEYLNYNFELTLHYNEEFFSDQINDEIKILEIYTNNNMNHVCFYTNHEENFIKTLEWDNFITPDELYLFFNFIFNSLPNDLYNKW